MKTYKYKVSIPTVNHPVVANITAASRVQAGVAVNDLYPNATEIEFMYES